MSEHESRPLQYRLTFRVAHPVDIPTCSSLSDPPLLPPPPHPSPAGDAAAAASSSSKSRLQKLQRMQHHAAQFFRCALLAAEGDDGASDDPVLVGYVCATRCSSSTEYSTHAAVAADAHVAGGECDHRIPRPPSHAYPTTHEPNGKYLAVHDIVVRRKYRRIGVATAMLRNFVRSVELYNAELDEAGVNRRRNRIKAKKSDAKIERIVLLSYSSLAGLFVSSGFRWRATVANGMGCDPLYELESEVVGTSSSSSSSSSPRKDGSFFPSSPDPSRRRLIEHDCFVVDAFAIPGEYGSGNPVAVIVLQDSPARLMAAHGNDVGESTTCHLPSERPGRKDDEELLVDRAEAWMHSVAKEFHQPAAAFVWPIDVDDKSESILGMDVSSRQDESSISDDEAAPHQSLHEENGIGIGRGIPTPEANYYISFFTSAGIEVDRCEDATLAAASVLFSRIDDPIRVEEDRRTLSFHSRRDVVHKAHLVLSSFVWEERARPPAPLPQAPPTGNLTARVAIDCPWRTVEPMPPGMAGQGAALSILRRAFFRAWSVVSHDDQEDDRDTDGLAFSLSADHVIFIGVTSEGEGDDLFVELTVEGFDMISGRAFDYDALTHWNGYLKGIIVCCEMPESVETNRKGLSDIDFCSRYFQPNGHVGEEQGSHGSIAPYFGEKLGKKRLLGFRSSDRGGLVECILNERDQTVRIIGSTMTSIRGKALMNF